MSATGFVRTRRAWVLAVAVVVILAWGVDHFWTNWRDSRPITMTGTVSAAWIPTAEWNAITPHPEGVDWDPPIEKSNGQLDLRAILLRLTLHASRYPDQNGSPWACSEVVFAHPQFPQWEIISAGPSTMINGFPTVSIQGDSGEEAFLDSRPGLVSPLETQGERLRDFSLQFADPYVSYVTAIAVVPADSTGDPSSIQAFASSTCVPTATFTGLAVTAS